MSRPTFLLLLGSLALAACQSPTATFGPTSASRTATQEPAFVFGSVSYGEREAVPRAAILDIELVDVSNGEDAARILATTSVREIHEVPVAFALRYDPDAISERRIYGIRARLRADGQIRFATVSSYPVLTRGNSNEVPVKMFKVRADGTTGENAGLPDERRIIRPDPNDDA